MATWTNQSKNTSTFRMLLRHGNEKLLSELESFTFEDVVFPDGTQLKDVTFDELTAIVWANINKSSAPTWVNQNKS